MSTIIEFTVPSDQFVLGSILQGHPNLRIELDRAVLIDQGPIPFFRLTDDLAEELETELRSDPLVDNVISLDRIDGKILYKITWVEDVHGTELPELFVGITASGAAILKAVGISSEWHFQLRFENYDAVTDFRSYCSDSGISPEISRIHTPQDVETAQAVLSDKQYELETAQAVLSDKQYELLSLAISEGYFEIPRQTRLEELTEMIGVTSGAASECLRRAQANFFTAYFSK